MSGRLRIGFDLVVAGSGLEEGAGGADNYVQGAVPELAQDPRVEELVLYTPTWYEGAHKWDFPKLRVVWCRVPTQRPLRVGWEQVTLPAMALKENVDVLFSGGNYRPLMYRRCNVLELHAIQHFVLGGGDVSGLRARYVEFLVPRSIRSADATITVTETLRQDAIKLWDLDPDRIVSVPMGPTPWVAELLGRNGASPTTPYRLPDDAPYALCISRLYSLKNHRRLIEAYAHLVSDRDMRRAEGDRARRRRR
jgi:glycosyltransferase involved in cell wall biosynthesis